MRFILSIVFSLITFLGVSQEARLYVANSPKGDGVLVRWVGQELVYREGVNIYRKVNKGNWELVTPTPIMPPTSIPNGLNFKGNQRTMFQNFLDMNHADFKENFDGIFTMIETIEDYNFALALNWAYYDKDVKKGKKYTYKIEGNLNGKKYELGETAQINYNGNYKLEPSPQNIEFKRKKKYTSIKWENNEDDFYAYDVYFKRSDSAWRKISDKYLSGGITEMGNKFYLNVSTIKDSAYYIKIQGLNYFGVQSEMSDSFKINVVDLVPPVLPEVEILTTSTTFTNVLTWTTSDTDLSHFNLLRGTSSHDSSIVQINTSPIPATDTSFTDVLKTDGSYYYRLQAVDNAGNSSMTFAQLGDIHDVHPPAVPTNFTIKIDTGKFFLNWKMNTEKDFRGYQIFRSVSDGNDADNVYIPVSANIINTNNFQEGLAKNIRNPFAYVVKSIDSAGNMSAPSEFVVAQLPDVVPPVAPFIQESYEENGNLAIKWMLNLENDLKGYNLYKRAKGDSSGFKKVNIATIPTAVNVYVDKEAERGQFYEYYLDAVDRGDLISPQSNSVLAKLNFLELAGDFEIKKQKISKGRKVVALQWSTDKMVNEPVIGMAVYRSFNQGKLLPITKVIQKTDFKEILQQAGNYTYQIRAYGERGSVMKSENINIEILND